MIVGSTTSGALSPREGATGVSTKKFAISATVFLGIIVGAWLLARSREMDQAPALSLLFGAALGVALECGRFCFFCIFRESIEERKTRALLSIVTALAVGAVGYSVVFGLYLPTPSGEGFPPLAHISPISVPLIAGAVAFGLGMVLSGACISGHLYRLGEGWLRSVPALIGSLIGFGLGFITWNSLYLGMISESPVWWLPRSLGYGGSLAVTLAVLGVLAWLILKMDRHGPEHREPARGFVDAIFGKRWTWFASGSVVGAIGVLAYLRVSPLGVTSQLGTVSRTFLDGQGLLPEVLHGIDVMKGCVGTVSSAITNNGWLVIGLVAASFASAVAGGRFKVVVPSVRGSATGLAGGVLLGWGAMTSLGCTVGVLLSGTQSFALSGVVFGAVVYATVIGGVKLGLHRGE